MDGNRSDPSGRRVSAATDWLRQLIAWIDPKLRPVYVLLPQAEYGKYRSSWKLP